jgi:hypothetical protein
MDDSDLSDLKTRLARLGDQVQYLLTDTGLDVIGFTILVQHSDALTGESRSRVSQPEYERAMLAYCTH